MRHSPSPPHPSWPRFWAPGSPQRAFPPHHADENDNLPHVNLADLLRSPEPKRVKVQEQEDEAEPAVGLSDGVLGAWDWTTCPSFLLIDGIGYGNTLGWWRGEPPCQLVGQLTHPRSRPSRSTQQRRSSTGLPYPPTRHPPLFAFIAGSGAPLGARGRAPSPHRLAGLWEHAAPIVCLGGRCRDRGVPLVPNEGDRKVCTPGITSI